MDFRIVLEVINSALLGLILRGLIKFHRDWSQLSLKVETLWHERETQLNAEIELRAQQALRSFTATAGVPHE